MLIGERGEDAAAALLRHASAHPAFQRLEPDHRSAIRQGRLEELDAAGIVNRRAGAGQREHGQPADLRVVVIHRGRQGWRCPSPVRR